MTDIHKILLLHLGMAPTGKRVLELKRGEDGVRTLEAGDHGVVVNGEHVYPWSMVMRADYVATTAPDEEPLESAFPAEDNKGPLTADMKGTVALEREQTTAVEEGWPDQPKPKKRGKRKRKP